MRKKEIIHINLLVEISSAYHNVVLEFLVWNLMISITMYLLYIHVYIYISVTIWEYYYY